MQFAARRKKAAADFTPVPIERPAPAFGAALLDGSQVSLESLRGRPAIAEARALLDERKLKDLRVAVSDSTALAFAVGGVPATYVVGKSGRIRFVHLGSLDDFVAMIEKELAIIGGTRQ